MKMIFATLSFFIILTSCNAPENSKSQDATNDAVYTPSAVPKVAITPAYFYGNWINQYYVEATTRKDTLRSYISYTFTDLSTYTTDSGLTDRWAYNASANSFFLYYSQGTTYAEYEVEVVGDEEFNLKRVYENNLFIYNFKKIK